ncbi:hypothetical protein DSM03_1011151 [Leeuwenhoekiella aestuarii]|uniref:Glutamine cyclotransferase n=1 Tax=Leeuwenhoekiella aestuarii TaxID=2249426 RepID=A0A4Q0P0Q4_9FLAO|nr:hypothetical protein [Leeuwenhoekiella aestuarii]RXG18465.1 hypothetical protein DSM04_101662 [Leeuwenhoekiella aestuarii]RXG19770.1 hypothetical protein DSM03_1011151 [Leeuwenhoekiella aestuarii]
MLVLPGLSFAQDTTAVVAHVLDTITPLKADRFIGVDSYNNLYYLKGRALFKAGNNQSIQFSDLRLGDISSVDLINPLKITVFYAETNTALILDNTLNEITRINFNESEPFRNVSHARTASDRRLWIFNTDLQRLELFDYQNNTVDSNFTPQPDIALAIAGDFNTCWVLTETYLYHYNQYGSLLSKQENKAISDIFLFNEKLFSIQNNKLFIKLEKNPQWELLKNLPQGSNQFYLKGGNLYLYRPDLISIYKLNLPKS